MNKTCEVMSSFGTFEFQRDTGLVTKVQLATKFGPFPAIVNATEWKKFYNVELPDSLDVLDVGYIDDAGNYNEPSGLWREEAMARRLEEAKVKTPRTFVLAYQKHGVL